MTTTALPEQGMLQSRDDFENTPRDQYKYWAVELDAATTNFRAFLRQGDHIIDRFLDTHTYGIGNIGGEMVPGDNLRDSGFRLNLFHSNVTTLLSTLYGNVPVVDVSRRFADSNDDVGRVAAEILERLLNADNAVYSEEVACVLRTGLSDRLTVGLGAARVRYIAQFEEPTDSTEEKLAYETCEVEYVHWRDVRWGWARQFSEIPWIGYRYYMTQDEASERFGEEVAKQLTYKTQQPLNEETDTSQPSDTATSAWKKCEVWEIWDKVERRVVWVSRGYDQVLDTKDDPLKLTDFFPSPPFFIANATSTLYIPTADFHLAQDLYNEIDVLQTRIAVITEAVRVVGVYDSSNGEIGRMLKEGIDNDLIPVENWALFGEKGGIRGQIDWLPIEDIVTALRELIGLRDQNIALLQQITGMNDIMRGDLSNQYEGVGQSELKTKYGSLRIQALEDQFAKYASDLMALKAEVICKHYEPQTIAMLSNAGMLFDRDLIPQALELLKNYDRAKLAVKIKPETLAMVDYQQLRGERTEFLTALATFMQSSAPLIEREPSATPFLLQLLQWTLAGFKGGSEVEGIIDKAIEAAQQAEKQRQQQQEQSPEEKMQQADQQFQMQMEQFKLQGELQKIQAKSQADVQARGADLQADIATSNVEHAARLSEIKAELDSQLAEIKAKIEADIQKEIAQAQANIMQTMAAANAEVAKDEESSFIAIREEAAKAAINVDQAGAEAQQEIAKEVAKVEANKDGKEKTGD